MEITEIRRAKLKQWFADRSLGKEKSYLSQLINGTASFGEKAARRLERTYGMPKGFLDGETPGVAKGGVVSAIPKPAFPVPINELIEIALKMNTQGQYELLGQARLLAGIHPAVKVNRAKS